MSDGINIDNVVRILERNRRLSNGLSVPIMRQDPPIGYYRDPNDLSQAISNEDHFKLLVQARKFLKESPYKEVADWLTKNGLPISHNGLHKLMTYRPPYTEDERRQYNT